MVATSRRIALGVFTAIEAFSFVFLLWVGRHAWFSQDEWDFLANRSAGDLGDLFRPKNEHLTTLPILVFRLLWWFVGLRSYVPYLVLLVALHLTVAALLRAVMLRADVGPWIATAAATTFVLFGTGYFNLVYAFQITFLGSLAFGLAHLLLADHEGRIDRRDALGLLAGLAGLMCSGVALAMVGTVGAAVLVRRGWRPALLHVGPLLTIYLVWLFTVGNTEGERRASLAQALRFTARELRATFRTLGQVPGVGLVLGILMVVGLVLAWRTLGSATFRQRAAAPAALLLGGIVFLFVTGISRGGVFKTFTPPFPASRYRYVALAMMLPAIALAADALSRRWKVLAPVVVVLLLIGVPGNVDVLIDHAPDGRNYKQFVLLSPRIPLAKDLPRSSRPEPLYAPWVTMGWMLDGVESGRIPRPAPPTPSEIATKTLFLALQPSPSSRERPCTSVVRPVIRELSKDGVLTVRDGSLLVTYEAGDASSLPRRLGPSSVVAVAGPLRLRLAPKPRAPVPAVLCG